MNVFKRRMFQMGGVVNRPDVIQSKPIFRGFRVPTLEGTESLQRIGDEFFVVTSDLDGNESSRKKIDLSLAPETDQEGIPLSLEERAIQANIISNQRAGLSALGLFGAAATAPLTGPSALGGLMSLPKLGAPRFKQTADSISKFLDKPGAISSTLKFTQDLFSPLKVGPKGFQINPLPAALLGGGLGVTSLFSQPVDLDRISEEQIESLGLSISPDVQDMSADIENIEQKELVEGEPTLGDDTSLNDEEQQALKDAQLAAEKEEQEAREKAIRTAQIQENQRRTDRFLRAGANFYQPGMTRAEALLNFGNVLSGEVDREEAAQAAKQLRDQQLAVDLFEKNEKAFKDFQKLQADALVQEQKINEAQSEIRGIDNTLGWLSKIQQSIKQDPVTGPLALFDELIYKGSAAIGLSPKAPPGVVVQRILKEIAQTGAGKLLGQSGARLSDRDMKIAERLLGDLEGINKLTATPDELLGIIARRTAELEGEKQKFQRDVNTSRKFFEIYQLPIPIERDKEIILNPDDYLE
ncbi:MAG: hypothetical protein CMI74_01790 [Candidatus Pelagibacter sp.]|nr:hypothetical protein [Candidatus Pelagibacter sp.]